jgi:hypothetical protein
MTNKRTKGQKAQNESGYVPQEFFSKMKGGNRQRTKDNRSNKNKKKRET